MYFLVRSFSVTKKGYGQGWDKPRGNDSDPNLPACTVAWFEVSLPLFE